MFRALGFRGLGVFNRCKDSGVWGVGGIEGLNFIQSVLESRGVVGVCRAVSLGVYGSGLKV